MVLLEEMQTLGQKGAVVKVSPGFARNYLYPTKRAVYATEPNILRHSLPYVEHLIRHVDGDTVCPSLVIVAVMLTTLFGRFTRRSYFKPLKFVTKLSPLEPDRLPSIPAYRVLDNDGKPIVPSEEPSLSGEQLTKMYKAAITLNTMDGILYDAQRQGRISFYMTNYGEEASHIGSAAALNPDDMVFGQYREAGVLLYRGFTLDNFMNQCYGNCLDNGKGRQMPIHYGSAELSFQTISSPLGTQIPQAVGAAYALKMSKKPLVSVCYFGEGAASEGDFHAALNMAATTESPVVFICRNNGYAISTPTNEQYRGDGIASRGIGYGMTTFRVDGNDLLAVYNTVKMARELCLQDGKTRPVLIEMISYRVGHHSTSDDSLAYRAKEEIDSWTNSNNPISRFRSYITAKGLWNDALEISFREQTRKDVLEALGKAEKLKKPPVSEMFKDVYDEMPWNLQEQQAELEELVKDHPEVYPLKNHVSF